MKNLETKKSISVSVIIAAKELNDTLKECIKHCLNLDYPDFEIIVFPDTPFVFNHPKVKVIATGRITPPEKRDLALKETKGEILAFIDDDAYPDRNWLRNAVGFFLDDDVGGVCGPTVTAPGATTKQRASGAVYESILVSGDQLFRFRPLAKRNVDDYPTCNLLVRLSIMKQLGGFSTNFWPGEDTFLCSGITEKLKKKIIYEPAVLVYHHRRPLFLPHLKQLANYARHRGYFVKKGYKSSLRLSYFLPSLLFLVFLIGGLVSLTSLSIRPFYFILIATYFLLTFLSSLKKNIRLIPLVFLGTILTHFCYGVWYIRGLFSRKLKEEK